MLYVWWRVYALISVFRKIDYLLVNGGVRVSLRAGHTLYSVYKFFLVLCCAYMCVYVGLGRFAGLVAASVLLRIRVTVWTFCYVFISLTSLSLSTRIRFR